MCLLRPCASAAQLRLILECMRYITRHKLDTMYPNEVKLMRDQWDAALLCALKSFNKLSEDPEAWYNNYKDLLDSISCTADQQYKHTYNKHKPLHYTATPQCSIHIHTHLDAQVFTKCGACATHEHHMIAAMLNQAVATLGVQV